MMKHSTHAPWAQWTIGIILMLFVIGAGGASLAANVIFGAQFHLVFAIILGMTDVAKIVLPAVAVNIGWDWRTRMATTIAIIFSVVSALSFMLQTQGEKFLQVQHSNAVVERASEYTARLQSELKTISESLPAATLEKLHADKSAAATREGERGFCGPKCEALKAEAADLLARLGQAQRREKLEAELELTKQTLADTPKQTVGPARSVASVTGADEAVVSNVVMLVLSIGLLIFTEIMAAMSDYAMRALRRAHAASGKTKKTVKIVTENETEAPVSAKLTKADALKKVQLMIFHAPGKTLITSRRALARELGVATSTFNDWCLDWQHKGLVITKQRGNETVFSKAAA